MDSETVRSVGIAHGLCCRRLNFGRNSAAGAAARNYTPTVKVAFNPDSLRHLRQITEYEQLGSLIWLFLCWCFRRRLLHPRPSRDNSTESPSDFQRLSAKTTD